MNWKPLALTRSNEQPPVWKWFTARSRCKEHICAEAFFGLPMGKGEFTRAAGQDEQQPFLHPGSSLKWWVCSRLSFSSFVVVQHSQRGEGGDDSWQDAWFFGGEEQQRDTLHPCCGHGNWHHLLGYRMVAGDLDYIGWAVVQCTSDGAIWPVLVLDGEHLHTLAQLLRDHKPSIPSHAISVVWLGQPVTIWGGKRLQCWKRDELQKGRGGFAAYVA